MDAPLVFTLYFFFFDFVHSLTASHYFKNKVYQFISLESYRLVYTLIAALTALPIVYLWFSFREMSPLLYSFGSPYAAISILMIIFGIYFVFSSFIITDLVDFTGLNVILKRKSKNKGLVQEGVYAITRHPLYLGGILVLWSNPSMKIIDFLASSLFTLYFMIGGLLEENKLEEEFGELYLDYKKEVSMMFPLKWILKRIIR